MRRQNGSMIGGKYRILELIGTGGASYVYLAEDVRLHKSWAVKEVFPRRTIGRTNLAGVLSEAGLLKQLSHPAFPRIVDMVYGAESVVIVMDYIEGKTLDRVLAETGPPDDATVLDWALQIAGILRYLHGQNPPVIYRDLKPANLILGKDGRIHIIDFNAARRYRTGKRRDTEPLGTRGYAPPEQYGSAQTDARSDIYAFGVTIREIAGKACPERLSEILNRCTLREPDMRYPNMDAVLCDLRKLRDLSVPAAAGRARRKHKNPASAVVLTLLLSAAFLIAGIFFRALSVFTTESLYRQAVVRDGNASFSDRESALYDAIASQPGNPDAYLELIRLYGDRGSIDEEESLRLRSCVLGNGPALGISGDGDSKKAEADVCRILYSAALLELYGHRFDDAEGDREELFRERALCAEPYFSTLISLNASDDDGKRMIRGAESYGRVCTFLETYGSNLSLMKDPGETDFSDLLEGADGCVEAVRDDPDRMTGYGALTVLLELSRILNQYRDGIARTASGREKLLSVCEKIESYAEQEETDNQKERETQSALLRTVQEMESALSG